MKEFKLTRVLEVYETCRVDAETREEALKKGTEDIDNIGQWEHSDCGEVDRIISVDELTTDGSPDITNDVVDDEFV